MSFRRSEAPPDVCKSYLTNRCVRENCQWKHPENTKFRYPPVCPEFRKQGTCYKKKCNLLHFNELEENDLMKYGTMPAHKGFLDLVNEEKRPKLNKAACPYLLTQGECDKGKLCPFRHIVSIKEMQDGLMQNYTSGLKKKEEDAASKNTSELSTENELVSTTEVASSSDKKTKEAPTDAAAGSKRKSDKMGEESGEQEHRLSKPITIDEATIEASATEPYTKPKPVKRKKQVYSKVIGSSVTDALALISSGVIDTSDHLPAAPPDTSEADLTDEELNRKLRTEMINLEKQLKQVEVMTQKQLQMKTSLRTKLNLGEDPDQVPPPAPWSHPPTAPTSTIYDPPAIAGTQQPAPSAAQYGAVSQKFSIPPIHGRVGHNSAYHGGYSADIGGYSSTSDGYSSASGGYNKSSAYSQQPSPYTYSGAQQGYYSSIEALQAYQTQQGGYGTTSQAQQAGYAYPPYSVPQTSSAVTSSKYKVNYHANASAYSHNW